METNLVKLSFLVLLNILKFILVYSSEYIEEIKLNVPTKIIVENEKVIRGNFKETKWKSWSDKISIESKILSPDASGNPLHLAVFYSQYSEAWILSNHSITTLCTNEISSLIIVASHPAPDSSPIEIEISILPKSILLAIDDKENKEHDVSVSAPLTFLVNPNNDNTDSTRNDTLLLTADDTDTTTDENELVCMIVGVYDGHCPLKK